MAYFYATQNQQWNPQEAITSTHHQNLQPRYTQPQYPQQQQSYCEIPSNVLRPNMAPSQQPTVPVSSYSTLTGAVDYSNAMSSSSRQKSASSTLMSRTSATPYPVPQHNASHSQRPTRKNSQTQALTSSRSARQCPVEDFRQAQKVSVYAPAVPPPSGPTNHILIPQPEYFDERDKQWRYGPRYPPIVFQTARFPEIGVRVGKIAHSQHPPPIEGPKDEIFAAVGDREVQLRILWPGYSSESLRKRVKTQGGKITRELFLTILAHAILDYTYDIYRKKVRIEPGYEKWTIGSKAEENTIVGGELFITRLVHRGGSNWQVELWAPKRF